MPYTLEEIRAVLKPLTNCELEAIKFDGVELPDLYQGLVRLNKERTAGVFLLNADDLEHGDCIQIKPEVVDWLLKGPEMLTQLLQENADLRERIALTDWNPREL